MKSKIFLYLSIISFLLLSLNTRSQEWDDIYALALETVTQIQEKGYEVVRVEFDILSTSTSFKNSARSLSSTYEYFILAFGSDDITDIDIEVEREVNGEWEVVADEYNDDKFASVKIIPPSTQNHIFNVYANGFSSGSTDGKYCIIVANKETDETDTDYSTSNNTGTDCNSLANLNISTYQKDYGVYRDGEISMLSESEESSLFEINEEVTVIKHTTESISSTYYVSTKEWSSDNNNCTIEVTSDVGNEYIFLVDIANNTFSVVGENDEGVYVFIYHIKSSW